jgi:hypothetical protein
MFAKTIESDEVSGYMADLEQESEASLLFYVGFAATEIAALGVAETETE